ncbi:uncharacterized protein LOC129590921 [Paramacrobiotus metropolitanus]|uniref:uncharacterized protein LOC129590921 n=1 Tax=Paramacrobiotus metropolitanus TaxID=2943436 RepID=UPI002445EDE6|nr:uncharacterized protein LOC129590921 [Paramacrobiotus metropolitanus]
MHLFAGRCKSGEVCCMYQWNNVDVLINGTLQHGVVVGISAVSADGQKQGLLIDFNYPQRHSEFVEYGSIFSCLYFAAEPPWDAWKDPTWAETHPLQALLRAVGDRAWTWCPVRLALPEDAEMRRAYCSEIDCGLVEVEWGGALTKELIPFHQIRGVPSPEDLQGRRVGPECFVSRECRLPRGYWAVPQEATRLLWQRLSYELSACCIAVRSDSFTYFQRSDGRPIVLSNLEQRLENITQMMQYENNNRGQRDGSPEDELICGRFVPRLRKVKVPAADHHQRGRGIPLPREILTEIFQSLDTIERVRKRRVCRLWEAMLDPNAIGKHLWISCRQPLNNRHEERSERFLLAACLLKYATSATDTVILEEPLALSQWKRDGFGLLAILSQQRRIRTLVFTRCEFSDCDVHLCDYLGYLNGKLSSLEATCSVVVFRDCEMSFTQTSAQMNAKLCLRDTAAQRLTQLWDAYERSLVSWENVDLAKLAAWVERCVSTQKIDKCEGILWVLNEYIGADPRTALRTADQEWTMANLIDLDVLKLTKLEQYALFGRIGDTMEKDNQGGYIFYGTKGYWKILQCLRLYTSATHATGADCEMTAHNNGTAVMILAHRVCSLVYQIFRAVLCMSRCHWSHDFDCANLRGTGSGFVNRLLWH